MGKHSCKSNLCVYYKTHIFACEKHMSNFCPAAELQCAVAATDLSITEHWEQQSARCDKLLLRQLNGARVRLHHATVELPVLFPLLFESAIKGPPFQVGLEAISLLPLRFRKKFRDDFFSLSMAVCFQCQLCDCFPSAGRYRGTLT